jgi:hypothetical protein
MVLGTELESAAGKTGYTKQELQTEPAKEI